jgi:hypothetical protein
MVPWAVAAVAAAIVLDLAEDLIDPANTAPPPRCLRRRHNFLSPKMVERHVRHILLKLGIREAPDRAPPRARRARLPARLTERIAQPTRETYGAGSDSAKCAPASGGPLEHGCWRPRAAETPHLRGFLFGGAT